MVILTRFKEVGEGWLSVLDFRWTCRGRFSTGKRVVRLEDHGKVVSRDGSASPMSVSTSSRRIRRAERMLWLGGTGANQTHIAS
jgi:hypothetical protein